MYSYTYDKESGGLLLNTTPLAFSKEPRPVYYQEMDTLGFDQFWTYAKDDSLPYMWAEANDYYYRGKLVASLKGGSLYTAPEVNIISTPEEGNAPLRFVDMDMMIYQNKEVLNGLVQDTIKFIYNTFLSYKEKVDIFHVSFSGGKDSEVALDLVQRALPHNEFVVIFGDTGMEFSDTYDAVKMAKKRCEGYNIKFYVAKSHMKPCDSWQLFGPPASAIRWCCSVHKTTPQLLKIREIVGKENFREMAFVGVRGDESVRRSGYDFISFGTKHRGQFSCNPILEWNSAEVYLYLYANNLPINKAYKKGNSRAGCLVCPMSARKSDYMNQQCYKEEADPYYNLIRGFNVPDRGNEEKLKSYLENTGWKARKNGRDLTIAKKDYDEAITADGKLAITFYNNKDMWKQWIKPIGKLLATDFDDKYKVLFHGQEFTLDVIPMEKGYLKAIVDNDKSKHGMEYLKMIRRVFRKSHYCVGCKVCEANCNHGSLKFDVAGLHISDACIRCGQCFDIDTGCLVYKSLWISKGNGNMKSSLDSYATHAPKLDWFAQFIKLESKFYTEYTLGNNEFPAFKKFLRDSGLLSNNSETVLAALLRERGIEDKQIWAAMLVNLCYSAQVGWFVRNFDFTEPVTQQYMCEVLSNTEGVSASAIKSVPNSIKRISALPVGELGFGIITDSARNNFTLLRLPWGNPDDLVILFSLYRFAEACGGFYQFSLSRLMDDSIESEGVSPAQIFGLDSDTIKRIVNGLSAKYPEFISSSFTLDLDNITLSAEKCSADVLNLF